MTSHPIQYQADKGLNHLFAKYGTESQCEMGLEAAHCPHSAVWLISDFNGLYIGNRINARYYIAIYL
jgi:hypothetical protein